MQIWPRIFVGLGIASAVVTGCGSSSVATQPARTVPVTEIAASVAPAAYAASIEDPVKRVELPLAYGTMVIVQRAQDPEGLAPGAPVSATVERALTRGGYRAMPAESGDVAGGFIVSPTVNALVITTGGSSTTISCRVTLRVSPWTGVERWEPNTTASASGEARATTSNAREQIALGVADCFEAAVRAAATRQIIPFLNNCEQSARD